MQYWPRDGGAAFLSCKNSKSLPAHLMSLSHLSHQRTSLSHQQCLVHTSPRPEERTANDVDEIYTMLFALDEVMLRTLSEATLRRLAQCIALLEMTPGQVLFRQGELADACFVILEGAVGVYYKATDFSGDSKIKISRAVNNGASAAASDSVSVKSVEIVSAEARDAMMLGVRIAIMTAAAKKQSFGDLSIIMNSYRSATCCAEESSRLLVISKEQFETILKVCERHELHVWAILKN